MIKTSLNIGQVLSLSIELQSLVKEDLAYKTKYWLNKLITSISKEVDEYEKIRIELVTRYGKENESGMLYVDESSEGFKDFMKSINEVISQETEIEHAEFNVDDFNFKSGNNYPIFDLLIQV